MRLYRVGLFTDVYFPNPNGVTTSVYLLLRELRRMGHEAWVVAPRHPEAPENEEGVVRVPSVAYPFYEGQQIALPSARHLPTEFELIHTHTPLTLGVWGLRIARNKGLPHVSTFHTHYEKYAHYVPGLAILDKYTGIVPRLAKAFYNRVEVVIAPTEPVKRLAEGYGIERPIRVIPTGIDNRLLEEAPLPSPSPWPEGTRRLITVGRLGKEKSFDVVLQAVAELAKAEEVFLVHIGEGPELQALEHLAQTLGIAERVRFLGPVPYRRIGGYYRMAELFLFASETETQGLVIWEAQAMGVPVVAVGAEGTLEGVEEGKTGYLVPPGDFRALAEKALGLLRDEEARRRMSLLARAWAMERSAERIAEKIVAVYDEASEILRAEPKRLIFPFPRLPQSSLEDRPGGF
ncbi:glycosyltransferase family 4 protein [Thermus sp.]|uniref:glycosyltransferase family 4 protein n=1 Tax=Thermus sp. TaxID=275 RepID=UPI0025D1F9E4|nr:glycosyltransferase family 4 protein [Thermus sp.]MCS6868085.1 glycosyltransferase family 4 protein [Thermus sp.]MDW8357358.1 glycosyltransferase family 4 protein [Thermus sp.]